MPIATAAPGKSLISPTDHTLVLIDFQSQMAFATKSIAPELLRNNAALISRAAKSFDVPTTLTTVAKKSFSGPMFEEIVEAFDHQPMLDRTSMNTWENEGVGGHREPEPGTQSRPLSRRQHDPRRRRP